MFRIMRMIFVALIAVSTAACQDQKLPSIADPTEGEQAIAKPSLEQIDISKMPPLGPKRMQSSSGDALGNKNQLVEDLIANGTDSVPFLINQLDDETEINPDIVPFWYQTSVGDMALIILSDLFTDETEMNSTIPGFSWDDFLERGKDKHLMGEEVLRRYIRKHGRKMIKQRWEKMWDQNKDQISWDGKCRCFKIV